MNYLAGLLTQKIETLSNNSKVTPFDFVIVGAGTTGLIFASILAKSGKRILLIEAGPIVLMNHVNNTELRFSNDLTRSLQRSLSYSPKTFDGNNFGSFVSCFGGRGLFWNGASPRFAPYDFKEWPLNYEDLNEYYELAEKAFNVTTAFGDSGLTQFLCRNLRKQGIEASPGPYAVDMQATQNGIIGSSIGNGVSVFMNSGAVSSVNNNVFISSECIVDRVLLNEQKSSVRGIVITDKSSNTTHEVLCNAAILTAGAFESTRIALSSSLPDPGNLIGKYISEHIFCRAYFPVPEEYYGKNAEAAIVHIPGTEQEKYQIEIHLPGLRLMRIRNREDWNPSDVTNYRAMMRSFGSVLPKPESRIELNGDNALGGYTVYMEYSPADNELREKMLVRMETVRKVLDLGEAEIEVLPSGSSYHECGGLRMGTDSATSVCDQFGRFNRVSNLISGDAASWPNISCANPHLTLAALAFYKANNLIKSPN